jgi:two-component system, NtrC family, response regulator HydG
VLAKGTRVDVLDLPEEVRAAKKRLRSKARSLPEVEREHILAVLEAHDGHRERAAEQLGIGIATLYRKLKQYEG